MGAVPAVRSLWAAVPVLLLAASASAQEPRSGSPNPFADFETHYLSNGVKVWFKHLPGVPNVSVSAGVPVGSDADPPGKEQLAHFTEHMLFSDHDGRTEQEIKDAVEGLGGRRNGVTYRDHTWYYVTIGREHGLFAIEWLAGILSPHAMDPEVVDRGRQPVENEIGARPRELFDHLGALLTTSWLTPPDFWEAEFGIPRLRDPNHDDWRSLQGITPDDLRGFYDRHYAPGQITVTIVGDLDATDALAAAESTFGTIPARPFEPWTLPVTDPERGKSTYGWGFQSTARYQSRHKLFDPTAADVLTALFIRDLLNRRLNQRLRYGERKAVYGASAGLTRRGAAAYLQISSRIDEDDFDFATGVIEEEIESLRTGSLDPAEFEADRAAVVARLRGSNQTSESLNFWTRTTFYDPATFTDFPDVLSYYENLTQSQVAAFAETAFDPSRQVLNIDRRQPVSQGTMVVAVVVLIALTLKGLKRLLIKPVRMREIRYIAHFKLPVALRTAYVLGVVGVAVAAVVLATGGIDRLNDGWIEGVDSYLFQYACNAVILAFFVATPTLIVTSSPRKLLVFSDHLRVKRRAWNSRILEPEDIADISIRRFPGVWLSRELLRGAPLTFGFLRPGIHLRPARGRSYFFRSRDTEELAEVLSEWWGRPVAGWPGDANGPG